MAKQNTIRKDAAPAKPSAGWLPLGGKALAGLDRLIHERMRLGIVSALAANT